MQAGIGGISRDTCRSRIGRLREAGRACEPARVFAQWHRHRSMRPDVVQERFAPHSKKCHALPHIGVLGVAGGCGVVRHIAMRAPLLQPWARLMGAGFMWGRCCSHISGLLAGEMWGGRGTGLRLSASISLRLGALWPWLACGGKALYARLPLQASLWLFDCPLRLSARPSLPQWSNRNRSMMRSPDCHRGPQLELRSGVGVGGSPRLFLGRWRRASGWHPVSLWAAGYVALAECLVGHLLGRRD